MQAIGHNAALSAMACLFLLLHRVNPAPLRLRLVFGRSMGKVSGEDWVRNELEKREEARGGGIMLSWREVRKHITEDDN